MNDSENTLSDELHGEIKSYCAKGDDACDSGDYCGAISLYKKAWDLIPEPQANWEASTWVLAAISDAYILNGDYDYAKEALEYAMHCPGALGNPYLHLRIGQACYELGDLSKAADELTRAYMGGGDEIFDGLDAKYYDFLKTKIVI